MTAQKDQNQPQVPTQDQHPIQQSAQQPTQQTTQQPAQQPAKVVIEFKGLSKEIFSSVWEKMKNKDQLSDGEMLLARCMADHPHWFPFFETIGIFDQSSGEDSEDAQALLHVNLHFLIGQQIFTAQPKEAQAYYQMRTQKGDSPHEIVHQMLHTFQKHLIWTAMNREQSQGQFDTQSYANTLKALAPLKKDQIWQRLGLKATPALHPEANQKPW
jgi:hypothetical protein